MFGDILYGLLYDVSYLNVERFPDSYLISDFIVVIYFRFIFVFIIFLNQWPLLLGDQVYRWQYFQLEISYPCQKLTGPGFLSVFYGKYRKSNRLRPLKHPPMGPLHLHNDIVCWKL